MQQKMRLEQCYYLPKADRLEGVRHVVRSSTTILVELDGKVSISERTWASGKDRSFQFDSKGSKCG